MRLPYSPLCFRCLPAPATGAENEVLSVISSQPDRAASPVWSVIKDACPRKRIWFDHEFPWCSLQEGPPVPIPNTEVKPLCAHGTAVIFRGRVGPRQGLFQKAPSGITGWGFFVSRLSRESAFQREFVLNSASSGRTYTSRRGSRQEGSC